MRHRRVVPRGARIHQNEGRAFMNTLTGTHAPLGSIQTKGMRLISFDKNRIIDSHEFLIFDSQYNYDIIFGGDFLRKIGMNLNYADLLLDWLGNTVPICT